MRIKFKNSFITRVFKSMLHMFTGNAFNTLSSLLSGYFYALILGPAVYGIWQTARVFQSYPSLFGFSIPFVMQRDYAMLRGEGRIDEANRIANQVFSYSLVVTPLISLGFFVYAILFVDDAYFKYSIFIICAVFLLGIVASFGDLLSKAINNYKNVATASFIAGIGALIIIPFIYLWGFYPLIVGYLITNIAVSIFYYIKRPMKYKWHWEFPLLKKMIVTALPLYLVVIASTIFDSIDRLIIASMMSFQDVGYYSLSSFITNPISLFVSSTAIVLLTQLSEKYGTSTRPDVVLKHVSLPHSIFSQLIPPILGFGVIALPLLTTVFLPKYYEGINAAQISVFATYFYLLAGFSSNGLFVLNKQKLSAFSFFVAGIIKTLLSILTIKAGFGIKGVAFSTLIAYLVYDSLMLYFVYKQLGINKKEYLKNQLDKLIPALLISICCIIFMVYYYLNPENNIWVLTISAEICILLISIPFFIKVRKRVSPYFT